jgi:pimeloyl-ACP methyl ester carboxylesterase
MPHTTSHGVEIYYETHGEGEPLLLVMGINAQIIHWPPEFIASLVEAGFQVIAFDNRDMGLSQRFEGQRAPKTSRLFRDRLLGIVSKTPYRLKDMAADGFGVLDELGISSAHVVGASMGGMIAQQMALQSPERVKSLTSMMSHTGERRHFVAKKKAVDALLGMNPTSAEEAGVRMVGLIRAIGSPAHLRPDADLRWLGESSYERCFNPAGFRRQLAAVVASGSRTKALRKLDIPTLVIHGKLDPLILCAGGQHTAATIPGARLVLVDEMAHDLPVAFHALYVREIARVAGLSDDSVHKKNRP